MVPFGPFWARQMVGLLDEYIPIVEGSEINDDPFQPISRYAREKVAELGDDTPIAWVHREERFAEKLATPDVTVADLIAYRMRTEKLVEQVAGPELPTEYGPFRIHAYRNKVNGEEHIALVMGEISPDEPVLVRVHSQCLTGDVFASARCDCGLQLDAALVELSDEHRVVVLLHDTEGYKLSEIEELTGVPVGTVKSRLHRARARLREILLADGTIS